MTTKAEMTPRERVMATLDLQEPDRVPVDLAQAGGDGITAVAYQHLIDHLGLPPRKLRIMSKLAQSVHVDEDVLQRFRVDFRRLDMGRPDNGQNEPVGEDGYRDEWGVVRTRPEGSYYYDLTESPFTEDTLAAIDRYPWPDAEDPGRYRGLRERARKLHENTDYAVVLNVNSAFFLRCAELRGWENFYMDMAGNPEFASALMKKYLDIRLRMAERTLEEVGDHVDIVFATSDDLGMTDRPIVSPEMYRQLIKPLQKKTFDFFKARTPAKRFFHSDGALYPIIADFIEIGVEVLNPIQVSAVGMGDTAKLKREFGDRLAFWGAIDTHQVLPLGTPEDVREEVRRRIADLGPGGGYVVCSVHNIQPEVPPENVVAMFDAAHELGRYPLNTPR
ncbi:MAG: uroporphyrinogen-III decarboxylase [Gemmatimonadetes bacterium]|jgi:uroporphyrinogen decarboxylase|nr:uroporphyrinogen-III decarboxylase [Gemmatimonadota bacterium]